jgi:hypothetical protein
MPPEASADKAGLVVMVAIVVIVAGSASGG